jgi:hypothetical protein|nr:hypothetical protein [Neorhizobium tomejilense]
MTFERGYRLRVTGLDGLSKLMGSYRTHALRIMAGAYAEQIARASVSALDASCVGLAQNRGDILELAIENVRAAHDRTVDGVYAPSLNCRIDFHFIGSAILADMVHGNDRYRKPWEARKEVVRWGWSEGAKPTHIAEAAWIDRERYWSAVGKSGTAGFGTFSFRLLEGKLPSLGWAAASKCAPSFEWRVEQCVRRLALAERLDPASLSPRDRKRLDERARSSIMQVVDISSFSIKPKIVAPAVNPKAKAGVPPQRRQAPPPGTKKEELASIVDHADIVVASDGRAFMAVPHVGFRPEDRVFIQVGSKDITFSQNGIQYGTVKNIPASSRDYLRGLTSIIVVEVREEGGKRLLRAKHTAMVSDISIGEGLRRPLQTFARRPRETDLQEI